MVDGRAISMSTLDDTARVYCEVTAQAAEQQQGVKSIDNAEIRSQAVKDLVLAEVAADIAAERGLKIPEAIEADADQLVEVFGAERAPDIAERLGKAQDLYNLFAVIGGDDNAIAVTDENAAQLADAGRTIVAEAFADHDVKFAPRLGLSNDGESNGSIGSLSVAPVDFEAPTPDESSGPQACRA